MKRFIAIVLVAVMLCGLLAVGASAADDYVVSPEYSDPEDPTPSSPQTGYEMGIVGVAVLAVLCGTAAVVLGKKAFQH